MVAAAAVGAEATTTTVAAATATAPSTAPAVLAVLALRLDMSKPFPASVVRSGLPTFLPAAERSPLRSGPSDGQRVNSPVLTRRVACRRARQGVARA
ncbi:hypothetical protein Aglo01_00810 [Actinokineospora globicatena]|nr:hypothetical protein Aglo01_00810 [Actinokineospora globicatena]GLW82439.1 hypothetical protein Aglo02_00800 [Actinokineospora globicatena]